VKKKIKQHYSSSVRSKQVALAAASSKQQAGW